MEAIFQKRGGRIGVAVGIIVIAIILCQWLDVFDPSFEGQSATAWLDTPGVASDTEHETRAEVAAAFRAMGPRGIRFLGRSLESRNLFHRESVKRHQAAAAAILRELGPDAAPALPSLVRIAQWDELEQVELGEEAMDSVVSSLKKISPEKFEILIPDLIEDLKVRLKHGDQTVMVDVDFLGLIGPKANEAIPVLRSIAQSGEPMLMASAAVALWNIHGESNAMIQCLSDCFSHHKVEIGSDWILDYVYHCAPMPKVVVPVLERGLRHPDRRIRERVAELLEKSTQSAYARSKMT